MVAISSTILFNLCREWPRARQRLRCWGWARRGAGSPPTSWPRARGCTRYDPLVASAPDGVVVGSDSTTTVAGSDVVLGVTTAADRARGGDWGAAVSRAGSDLRGPEHRSSLAEARACDARRRRGRSFRGRRAARTGPGARARHSSARLRRRRPRVRRRVRASRHAGRRRLRPSG